MIKKYYRKLYRAWLGKKLTKAEFKHIITDLLGMQKGDSVLVHASFGNLKADFSPKTAVEILMEAVGNEGNLLMPYYPYDSRKFLESGETFNVHTTPTRSGILSATFAKFPGVKKSIHPIKSLAVWGKDRDELISEHHLSKTPFDANSPYSKLLKIRNSKAIGLAIFKNAGVHSYEDIIESYPRYYSDKIYKGLCLDYNGEPHTVNTKIHDAKPSMAPPCEYLRLSKCPDYNELSFRRRRFYASDYIKAYNHIKEIVERHGFSAEKAKMNQSLLSHINSKLVRL